MRRRKWILRGSLCANIDTLDKSLLVLRCIRYKGPCVTSSIVEYDAGASVDNFDFMSGVIGESRQTK